MPLQIVGGKLCCIWGLALCATPTTDSGLRIKTTAVSGDATKIVVYGGNCYVILKNITTCGTVITPTSVVSSCTDAACGFTTCPSCGFSDVLTVGSLDGAITNCYFSSVFDGSACSCTDPPAAWDGSIYRTNFCSHASDGVNISCGDIQGTQPVDNVWDLKATTTSCSEYSITLTDGSKLLLTNVCLSCGSIVLGGVTHPAWLIHVATNFNCEQSGQTCGRAPDADYYKLLGTGPTGTYTKFNDTMCCDGVTAAFPATITIS